MPTTISIRDSDGFGRGEDDHVGISPQTGNTELDLTRTPGGAPCAVTAKSGTGTCGLPVTTHGIGHDHDERAGATFRVNVRMSPGLTGSDDDGIPDEWEATSGFTVNGHFIDLPKMGADQRRPDIFIQLDRMQDATHDQRLSDSAIQQVVNAFAIQGINLHVDEGPSGMLASAPRQPAGSLSAAQSTPWQANLGSLDAGGNYGGSDDSSDQKHQLHPDRPSADLPHAFTVASEGANTVEFFSRDFVGNVEQTQSTSFKIDVTPPTVVCAVSPGSLAPPSHKLVPVAASVNVADAGSGPAGFTLTGVDSSEPDDGLGDGDTPNDIQGFTLGTPDTTGQLRAERAGDGSGRI